MLAAPPPRTFTLPVAVMLPPEPTVAVPAMLDAVVVIAAAADVQEARALMIVLPAPVTESGPAG